MLHAQQTRKIAAPRSSLSTDNHWSTSVAPVVQGKKMLVATSRGGMYGPDSPVAAYDFQEPWLRSVFGFLGVTDVTFVHAEGMNLGDEARQSGLAKAEAEIDELAKAW